MRRWLVKPTTIIELTAWNLRRMILRGELHPGERLVESQLSKTLDVSRASLREALRILESERLVLLAPNRGYSIADISLEELSEIHDVWALLTGDSVYRFTQLASSADIENLRTIVRQIGEDDGEPVHVLDHINRFFGSILERCDNKVLQDMVWNLVSRINFLRSLSRSQDVSARRAAELAAIVDAIENRKPEAARAAVIAHIESACSLAQTALRERLDGAALRASA